MMRAILFTLLALAASLEARALRDDLPLHFEPDCAGVLPASAEFREACALAAFDRACARDPDSLVDEVARTLGVHTLQVLRGMGRHYLASPERGELCARDAAERRQLVAAARAPKRTRSESGKEWLLYELGGWSGRIDHAAVGRAFEQRERIVFDEQLKRAGLPPAPPMGWTNLTGYTQSPGRINHILFTSATGNDILAGADGGGIWRSTDAGASWSFVNDFFGSLSIANFAKAGNDANTIYAATNTRGSHTYFPFGILKSTNGGVTWDQLALTSPGANVDFTYVQRVAVHPSNSGIVLAATEGGAYESVNGGASWTKVGGISTTAYYVAFHPTDGNRRAIGYHDGTVRYTTTGDLHGAGALTSTVLAAGRYTKLAYAKSDVTRMYALVTDSANGNTRLYMSSTSGATWVELTAPGPSQLYNSSYLSYTGGLWVDPLNANRVAMCEGWAWFSADATAVTPTWTRLYSGWVDFHGIVEHPGYDGSANKTVYFMDDGGLYRTTNIDTLNSAGTFARIESGMTVSQVYSVAGHRGNPIFGAQDIGPKVYRTDPSIGDATTKWRFTSHPADDALCPSCYWIGDGMTTAASRSNPAVLYGSRQYLDLFRSIDGGVTASSLAYGSALNEGTGATTANYNAAFLAPFVLDPSNQSRMYAAGTSLWRTANADTGTPPTWTAIRAPFADPSCGGSYIPPINAVAVAPSNPDIVWIAYYCAGKVFKSTNATQASPVFTEVTTMPAAANFRFKGAITIDRYDPNIVWLGLTNYQAFTLFKTTDGGATPGNWSQVAGLPGAPVRALAQHPASSRWLYAATHVGLFASHDGGATWSGSNEGPANVQVISLAWNTMGPVSELLVGTYGRGVWKAVVGVARTDVNGDGRSDMLYRNTSTGQLFRMHMNGFGIANGALVYAEPNTSWKIVGDGDFNGDGVTDLVWRNSSNGQVYVMPFAANGFPAGGAIVHIEPNQSWKIVQTPDLDGDGRSDLLWHNEATGQVYAMLMNGTTVGAQGSVYTEPNTSWRIAASGDFAGSGRRNQLLWRNGTTGQVFLMTVNVASGAFSQTGQTIFQEPNTQWSIVAAPDLDGDGRSDMLWRNSGTGQVYAMLMNGGAIVSQGFVHHEPNLAWRIVNQGDYDGDGKSDLLWRNESTGQVYMMRMNGLAIASQATVYQEPNLTWRVLGPVEYATP